MKRCALMNQRAQGLPITTVILAILGIVVLVILFAITTGRLAIFTRGVSECPGTCRGEYTTDIAFATLPDKCGEFEKQITGSYVAPGQDPRTTARDQIVKCKACCVPVG